MTWVRETPRENFKSVTNPYKIVSKFIEICYAYNVYTLLLSSNYKLNDLYPSEYYLLVVSLGLKNGQRMNWKLTPFDNFIEDQRRWSKDSKPNFVAHYITCIAGSHIRFSKQFEFNRKSSS